MVKNFFNKSLSEANPGAFIGQNSICSEMILTAVVQQSFSLVIHLSSDETGYVNGPLTDTDSKTWKALPAELQ